MELNENEALIDVAKDSVHASSRIHIEDGVPCGIKKDGELFVMDDLFSILEKSKSKPGRRCGRTSHTELESFISFVNRMKQLNTTVWADVQLSSFICIFNDHEEGAKQEKSGWRDHRTSYSCPVSPEWEEWTQAAGEWMSQDMFADFLDAHFDELTGGGEDDPTPVEMLEVARNLQIYTKGVFEKKVNPTTGEYSMICKEEHGSESTKIPRAFYAGLRVFEGGDIYKMEVRIRFRISNRVPAFSIEIYREKETVRDAFNEMRSQIADKTECPVFAGTP